MFHPRVSGIIATDVDGNIVSGEGTPVLHGTEFEDMDRSIFREYLNGHAKQSGRAVIVSGRNNYKSMGSLTACFHDIVLSDESSVEVVGKKTINTSTPKDTLLYTAYSLAFQKRADIFVLGGKSVYEAFQKHYSHFVHVECMRRIEGASKPVRVYHGSLSSFPTTPTLITRDMNIPVYRLIDNGKIRVTEYNAWE